jgi:hypothetical protein
VYSALIHIKFKLSISRRRAAALCLNYMCSVCLFLFTKWSAGQNCFGYAHGGMFLSCAAAVTSRFYMFCLVHLFIEGPAGEIVFGVFYWDSHII